MNNIKKKIIQLSQNGKSICLILSICSHPFPKITGVSRGFCFVQFSSVDEARTWIEKKQVETTKIREKNFSQP